jgi:hypothetical protein
LCAGQAAPPLPGAAPLAVGPHSEDCVARYRRAAARPSRRNGMRIAARDAPPRLGAPARHTHIAPSDPSCLRRFRPHTRRFDGDLHSRRASAPVAPDRHTPHLPRPAWLTRSAHCSYVVRLCCCVPSACAVLSVATNPCATPNVVGGTATEGTDATVEWVSADGKVKITGCNNTVAGNTVPDGNIVQVLGSNNIVRPWPTDAPACTPRPRRAGPPRSAARITCKSVSSHGMRACIITGHTEAHSAQCDAPAVAVRLLRRGVAIVALSAHGCAARQLRRSSAAANRRLRR